MKLLKVLAAVVLLGLLVIAKSTASAAQLPSAPKPARSDASGAVVVAFAALTVGIAGIQRRRG